MARRYGYVARVSRIAMAVLAILTIMVSTGAAAAGRLQVGALASCTAVFEPRLVEAERLLAEAAAAGSEWLDTEELLNRAKDEAANGNMEVACSLLELAAFQARMAIRQAEHEADAWSKRVVRRDD